MILISPPSYEKSDSRAPRGQSMGPTTSCYSKVQSSLNCNAPCEQFKGKIGQFRGVLLYAMLYSQPPYVEAIEGSRAQARKITHSKDDVVVLSDVRQSEYKNCRVAEQSGALRLCPVARRADSFRSRLGDT